MTNRATMTKASAIAQSVTGQASATIAADPFSNVQPSPGVPTGSKFFLLTGSARRRRSRGGGSSRPHGELANYLQSSSDFIESHRIMAQSAS